MERPRPSCSRSGRLSGPSAAVAACESLPCAQARSRDRSSTLPARMCGPIACASSCSRLMQVDDTGTHGKPSALSAPATPSRKRRRDDWNKVSRGLTKRPWSWHVLRHRLRMNARRSRKWANGTNRWLGAGPGLSHMGPGWPCKSKRGPWVWVGHEGLRRCGLRGRGYRPHPLLKAPVNRSGHAGCPPRPPGPSA